MILSQGDIEESLNNDDIKYDGEIRGNSLLLKLGSTIQKFSSNSQIIDPYDKVSLDQAYDSEILSEWQTFNLNSQQLILCSSKEYLYLGNQFTGVISTLSHVARFGIMIHPSSFIIDAEFNGYITLELYNLSPHVIKIRQGMPIGKIILFKMREITSQVDINNQRKKNFYGGNDLLKSQFYKEFHL